MCYNLILSSVNYVFDCFYSPGRDLGRGFFSSEAPNKKETKTFSAYGAMTNASLREDSIPVEIQVVKRAEETQNKPALTETFNQTVPTSPNDEEHGFTKVGDECTGFYKVDISGELPLDDGEVCV